MNYLIHLKNKYNMLKTIKPQEFTEIIEKIVNDKKMTYIDALVYYCAENNMEPETVGKLVQGFLKNKIREEAINLHFLPKTATIPGL
tara:strand:+ start:8111 stop:8371 length:261 start_codon:yes stop_codon:yes gene_type:complete